MSVDQSEYVEMDPEARLYQVEQQVKEINVKLDHIVTIVDEIAVQVSPLINSVMESPWFKMIVGKGKS